MDTYSDTVELNDAVRYVNGSRLSQFRDQIGIVKAIRRDPLADRGIAYGVWFGDADNYMEHLDKSNLVWAAVSSWRKIPTVNNDYDLDKLFTDAAGGPLEVAKAELERLEKRVAELRTAIAVIEGISKS